jgi:Domain of unknown function (DUF4357)
MAMAIGKSISLFLIDGTVDGLVACELFNWTGKGYKIPRPLLKTLSDREDLKKAGIYFLLGHADSDKPIVYIGEAEEVYKRLTQHQEKDFWSEALVFISKDENLNKAHIKYLEYSLHKEAQEISRYEIHNANTPAKPAISEAERAVMMEFSANLQLLVGTLGYKLFEPLVTRKQTMAAETYRIDASRGAAGRGVLTNEGFVVLKGSKIAHSEVPSTPPPVRAKRAVLLAEKAIENWTVTRDLLFNSPSIAAAVVLGRSANGLIEWKKEDGTTLKQSQDPNSDS